MIKIENEDISYKELIVIDADVNKHSCDVLGILDDGNLLFIREEEAHMGNCYYMQREFFQIDPDEYFNYLGIAAKNIRLQRAISKEIVVFDVFYKGEWFKMGSSILYIAKHHEFSIFTDNTALAEKNNFDRIDKFEYEKTIHVSECELIRIIHNDADGNMLTKQEINPAKFKAWLNTLC